MPAPRPPLALLLLFSACGPTSIPTVPGDSGASTPTGSVTPSTETTEPDDSATTDSAEPLPFFSPGAGTFVDPFTVTLDLEPGETAWYTDDGSLPTAKAVPYVGPVTVSEGVELRVLRRDVKGQDSFHAKSYVRLDPAVAAVDSNLPIVVLFAAAPLGGAERDYLPTSFQVHEPQEDGRAPLLGTATMSSRAAIKVRGSSTSGEPKRSYALELRETYSDEDDSEAILGMPADSDWVLYAPLTFDRAFIRNALMYRLSNDLGRYAPRTRFAEVYAVGRGEAVGEDAYQGVYVLMERITVSPDRVAITPLDPADVAPPEVSGGYLYKRDRVGDGESGFTAGTGGGAFSFDDPLVYVDPDEDEIAPLQSSYLADAVDDFAAALLAPDHTHDGVHYRDMVDVDAWVDNHILYLYAKNPDALRLSSHMYKDRGGPMVAGPIWDFDRAMGCTSDDRASNPTWWDATNQTSDTTPMFTYGWYAALFDDPEFAALYWPRLQAVLDDTLGDAHVTEVIEAMAAELSEAAPRNYQRWSGYGPTTGSFEGEIAALEEWFSARHAWAVACLAAHPDDPRLCQGS